MVHPVEAPPSSVDWQTIIREEDCSLRSLSFLSRTLTRNTEDRGSCHVENGLVILDLDR